MKKIIKSLFLVTAISLVVTGVFVARYVKASSSTINVTVPAKVDVVFNSDGSNTISKFNIVNNSLVPIEVVDVVSTPVNGWELVSDTTTLTKDTKKLKLTMQNKIITSGVNSLGINVTDGTEYIMPITVDRGTWTNTIKEQAFKLNFNYEIGKKEFQLSFNANGGTPINTQTLFNGDVITLPNSSKRGYTLVSWIDSNGVSYTPGSRYTMPIGDTTLTAQWEINKYTFDINGELDGVVLPNTKGYATFDLYVNRTKVVDDAGDYLEDLDYNTIYDIRDIRTKPGFKFLGDNCISISDILTEKLRLALPLATNTYTIKYNLNGGSITGNTINYKTSSNDISIPTPIKTGYSFAGWDESLTPKDWYNGFIDYYGGDVISNETYPNAVFSELIDVKAGTYSLSSEGLPNDQVRIRQYRKDGSYVGNIVGNSYTTFQLEEDGYVRILLLENDEITKNTIKLTRNLDTPIINKGSAGNREYVAKWTANSYTVVYHGNADVFSGTTAKSTHFYDSNKPLTTNGFAFLGHSFNGWSTSTYGLGKVYKDKEIVQNLTSINGDTIHLYAQWKPNEYSLTINANNGDPVKTETGVFGETIDLGTPSRLGFTFASWKLKDTSTGAVGIPTRKYNFSNGTLNGVSIYKYGSTDSELYGNIEVVPASSDNPTASKYEVKMTATTPYEIDGKTTYVGFKTGSSTKANNSYYHTFKAKVPKGVKLGIAYNNRGTGSSGPFWITSPYGTGEWETYSYATTLGSNPNASTIGYVYVMSIDPSVSVPFSWNLAETEIVDVTNGNVNGTTAVIGSKNNIVEAQWRPIEYSIGYELDGGTLTSNVPTSYNITSDAITLPNPTKTGHSFMGWIERIKPSVWYRGDLSHDGAIVTSTRNAYYSDKLYVKAGQTYKWDSDGLTSGARFYPKDGSTPVYITHEQTGFTPSQDGYIRLLNVYHDTNLDRAKNLYLETITPVKDLTISKGSTGNREYIAKWTLNQYTLDVNGYLDGTLVGPRLPLKFDMYLNGLLWKAGLEDFCYDQNYGTKYEIKNIVPNPGYSCNGVVTGSLPLSGTITSTSYVVLNATTNNYTIGYNLSGGAVSGNPTSYKVTSNAITLNNPTRTGYTFVDWTEELHPTSWAKGFISLEDGSIGLGSTGSSYPYAKYSEYIKVEAGKSYSTSIDNSGTTIRIRAYDNELNYLGSFNDTAGPAVYTPKEDGYVRLLVLDANTTDTNTVYLKNDVRQSSVTITPGSTGNRVYTANWREHVLTVNYYSNYATKAFASALNPVGADKNVLLRVVQYPASAKLDSGLHDYTIDTAERIIRRDGYTGTGDYGTELTGGNLVNESTAFNNSMELAKALGTSIDNSDATINVYPQWKMNTGAIYYYPNGGVISGPFSEGHKLITSGEFAGAIDAVNYFRYDETTGNTVADISSYFTRTGYHSAPSAQAWRLGSPTSTTYIADNNQDLSIFVVDKTNVNLKLYANWVANTYTVSYNANGGSGTTASSSHTYDTSKALTSNGFSKTGYTFSGWNTKADGSGTSYTNAQSVKNLTATQGANITLYAQWKVNTYTYNINYKSSTGKSLGTSTVSGTFGSSKSVSAPAKTGYTTPSAQTVKFDSTSAKTITFTYPIVNYTISYNLGGGTVSGNPTSYNIESSTITLKNPTKTGFTFQGWTGSNGSSVQTLVSIASGSTGNKSYTANWAVNNYTITFNANGGSVSTASKTVASGAQYGTLPTPTRTGYTFAGWYTATSGGTKVSTTTVMGTSNVTVYARWTANTNTKITVKHNTMNYDGHTYTLADTVTTIGTSDATITLSNYKKSYSGLTYTSGKVGGTTVTTTTVSADGSRIIDLYYSRDEAVLVNGSSFKTAMTTVGPNATSVAFQKEPIASSKVSTAKVVSDSTSTKKAYMYLDGTKIVIAPESTGVMISANTDCSTMFYNRTPLTSITFDNFNTSRTTNMFHMFGYLPKLTTLDLTSFNTSNVTSMASMFIGCTGFTSIDVSSFDVSNVTNLAGMFMDCENITTLNLSNFKTGNTLYFKDMFNGMTKLATLNISNFNTSKATTFQSMFAGCSSLRSIALTKFRTTNVTNMADMFKGCSSLVGANLTYFNTSKVTTMSGMFDGCTALKTVTAATLNTSSLVDTSYMFRDAINVSVTMTISSNKITKYTDMFKNAATSSTASIVLNPATEDIRPLVQNMVNTKSSNSNVSVKQ